MFEAEKMYREAFERLKAGCPVNLPLGTPVSQNNVAAEAGRDPSALKKSRYPTLVADIQAWILTGNVEGDEPAGSTVSDEHSALKIRQLTEEVQGLKAERDELMSKLLAAHERIVLLNFHLGGK